MNIYRTTITATGQTYDYSADAPIVFDGMTGNVLVSGPVTPPVVTIFGGKRWLSKLEFTKLFTNTEFAGILSAAGSNSALNVWWQKFLITTPTSDGTSMNLDDSETILGVRTLEGAGLIAVGRSTVILNG